MTIAFAAMLLGTVIAWLATLRPSITRITPPNDSSFSMAQVRHGSELAALGSCAVCHTSDGGVTFAGGRGLATPFGTIFTSNITPDPATGIGAWSSEAFRRAMREGVSRDGHHLYPALPYEHFTHTSDADLDALYAYFMTRGAIRSTPPANRLIPPLGFRPLLAGWKLLFLHGGPHERDPRHSDEWNRGAYLVDTLGHCGGCHTPRNFAGGEEGGRPFAGGFAEGWQAPALDASNPQAATWTADSLMHYLRGGVERNHGVAAGPMGPVAHELTTVPESDVRAIAVFIESTMHPNRVPVAAPSSAASAIDRVADASASEPIGATIFAGACAGCHEPTAPMAGEGRPLLSSTSTVLSPTPDNALQAVLSGVRSPDDGQTPYMPAFRESLTDEQAAAVVAYVRSRFSDRPAWKSAKAVSARLRKEGAQP